MWAIDLPVAGVAGAAGASAARAVRALGGHRYVRGRMHLVHAFAIDAASIVAPAGELAAAAAWAREVLDPATGPADLDPGTRDERLVRSCTDAELAAVLGAFWGDAGELAAARLLVMLAASGLDPLGAPDVDPFDADAEEDVFPLLVDAGWELLPLAELDAERHRGALAAFEPDALAAALFEERESVPPRAYLHELPAMGVTELTRGRDALPPLPLWVDGPEAYMDYVVRGVCKVAGLGALST